MHQRTSWILAGVLAAVLVLALTGCGPADVSTLRRNYTAELNGWVAKEEPMAIVSGIDTVAGSEEDAEPGTEGEAAEEPGEAMSESSEEKTEGIFTSQTVVLDILVRHTGGGTLPGLTLDITQGGADGQEKANWKLWVDTSDLGGVKQITHTLEGVDLDEGDGFFVEVRQHVPEAERGEYKEFSSPS